MSFRRKLFDGRTSVRTIQQDNWPQISDLTKKYWPSSQSLLSNPWPSTPLPGHCFRASARQVQVTLGDYVINSAVEPLPAYTFGVRKINVHPYFKFTPQADRYDVAVLRLDRPVQYMPHIAPICLPEKGEDFLGQYGWAAGWGALQAGNDPLL